MTCLLGPFMIGLIRNIPPDTDAPTTLCASLIVIPAQWSLWYQQYGELVSSYFKTRIIISIFNVCKPITK